MDEARVQARAGRGLSLLRGSDRNGDCGQDARQRRVHAGLEHAHPHEEAGQRIGRDAFDAAAVENDQPGHSEGGEEKRGQREIAGVKEGDDHDRAEVVDNGERQQKIFSETGARAPKA